MLRLTVLTALLGASVLLAGCIPPGRYAYGPEPGYGYRAQPSYGYGYRQPSVYPRYGYGYSPQRQYRGY